VSIREHLRVSAAADIALVRSAQPRATYLEEYLRIDDRKNLEQLEHLAAIFGVEQ